MMTELFGDLLHKDDQLTDGQMICRAVVAFLLTIALVRLAGRRSFGMRSPFDTVISLLLGATLSRGIVGASLALVILHRLLAYLCIQSPLLSRLVSGNDKILFENGHFNRSHMKAMLVSEQDLREAVRQVGQKDSIIDIKTILIERNGQISVVNKDKV